MPTAAAPIKVLVTDDAVVVRRILTTVIGDDPELEVVGIAHNGLVALQKIELLKPDVVTLDIEMPEMDGLTALAEIRRRHPSLPVIMFSTLTERGASATLEALSLGASDYVTKPANVGSVNAAMERVRADLIPRIKALVRPPAQFAYPPMKREVVKAPATGRIDVVAIGSSTGGPNALAEVVPALRDVRVPIVITQHMPPVFTGFLAQRLDAASEVTVREAADGERLEPGVCLIAPGDRHLTFTKSVTGAIARLDDGPPENFCRPSVDVMFRSLVEAYGGNVLAVVLTGMGHDGRDGSASVRERGGAVLVQDKASSVVWGMPGAVAMAGLADDVLPLGLVAKGIMDRLLVARASSRAPRPGAAA